MEISYFEDDINALDRMMIIALFGGFSIFLSSIEYLLPRPLPFFRYGLANITLLLAIRFFSFKDLFLLTLIKVLGLGILNGTFASYVFVFSLLGSLGAFGSMWSIERICREHVSLIGISVVGALVSNVIQIICAVWYIFGEQAWIIAPYLLLLGSISGLIIGLVSQFYWNKSWILGALYKRYRVNNEGNLKPLTS